MTSGRSEPASDLAKCLDGAAIGVGCLLEASRESDVVFERQVNDAVRGWRLRSAA